MIVLLLACKSDDTARDDDTDVGDSFVLPDRPRLTVRADHREVILDRIDREPYSVLYERIVAHADRETAAVDPGEWHHNPVGDNAEKAFSNAFLAWLHDDGDRAEVALDLLADIPTHWETQTVLDVNIRMPHTLMGYTDAHDLLIGGGFLEEDDALAIAAADDIGLINQKFYDAYIRDTGFNFFLQGAQNNHPIRTAAAIGYVALAFPDHPDAADWRNWSISELDYLWGVNGKYVQADGGVSEGPFYYGFAYGPTVAFATAADAVLDPSLPIVRDCRMRVDIDPWNDHGCVEGETFLWDNPLYDPWFQATVDWSISLRLPDGQRPPLADAYFNPLNGGSLLERFHGRTDARWDWTNNAARPYEANHGQDLLAHHLAWVDDTTKAKEPDYTTVFLPDAGNAIFRSDWSEDARWLLLVAEAGPARKTIHDHVDGTSFSLAAYGEYLLADPGYYKPNPLNNAETANAPSHNVILIDGEGAPEKGLITDFGDVDAHLRNTHIGDRIAYAEAHQSYLDTDFVRSVVFVDEQWFVVADRLKTSASEAREHTWRLHANAGFDSGGTASIDGARVRIERDAASLDVHLASSSPVTWTEPAYAVNEPPHVGQFGLDRAVRDHLVYDGVVTAKQPDFLAVLTPFPDGGTPAEVQAVGELAWLVDDVVVWMPGGDDLVLPDAELSSDAELVVVALDGSYGLTVGGTVDIDGVEAATEPID